MALQDSHDSPSTPEVTNGQVGIPRFQFSFCFWFQPFLQSIADDMSKLVVTSTNDVAVGEAEAAAECSASVQSCLENLEQFRRVLLSDPSNFFVHVSADLNVLARDSGVDDLERPWLDVVLQPLFERSGKELGSKVIDLSEP